MTQLGLYLYLIQKDINTFLNTQIAHVTLTSLSTIFIGGLLTSMSPCMLSCLPISLAYMDHKNNKALHGFMFISGTITSIMMICLSSLIIKKSYTIIASVTTIITPILIIIIGLSLLNIIEIDVYTPYNSIKKKNIINNSIQSYILGISIGFNISPCTTPILMTLIAWITNTQQILTGYIFLLTYTFGYIIPLIISLISLNNIRQMQKTNVMWNNIIPFSGSIVVATGTFSLFTTLFSIVIQ